MLRSVDQVSLNQMERGLALPIATLNLDPAEITRKIGLRFEVANDDLDSLEVAIILSDSGRQFALVRHLHQPLPGTDILTSESSSSLGTDLRDALQTLRFSADQLRWTHPDVDQTGLASPPAAANAGDGGTGG